MSELIRGTLKKYDNGKREAHPATQLAYDYIATIPVNRLMKYREAMASCAIEGNRLAEVCGETLGLVLSHDPTLPNSDIYILGLAVYLRVMEADDER